MLEISGILIAAIAAGAAVYNVSILVKSFKADHDRRRKQATFEYVGDRLREALTTLDEKINFKKLTKDDCIRIFKNTEDSAEIAKYLSVLEHISVGVNRNIYDKDVLYDMASTYIVDIYQKFAPYIKFLRKRLGKTGMNVSQLYTEFEELAAEFEEKHAA